MMCTAERCRIDVLSKLYRGMGSFESAALLSPLCNQVRCSHYVISARLFVRASRWREPFTTSTLLYHLRSTTVSAKSFLTRQSTIPQTSTKTTRQDTGLTWRALW